MIEVSRASVTEVVTPIVAIHPEREGRADGNEVVGVSEGMIVGTNVGADVRNWTQFIEKELFLFILLKKFMRSIIRLLV